MRAFHTAFMAESSKGKMGLEGLLSTHRLTIKAEAPQFKPAPPSVQAKNTASGSYSAAPQRLSAPLANSQQENSVQDVGFQATRRFVAINEPITNASVVESTELESRHALPASVRRPRPIKLEPADLRFQSGMVAPNIAVGSHTFKTPVLAIRQSPASPFLSRNDYMPFSQPPAEVPSTAGILPAKRKQLQDKRHHQISQFNSGIKKMPLQKLKDLTRDPKLPPHFLEHLEKEIEKKEEEETRAGDGFLASWGMDVDDD